MTEFISALSFFSFILIPVSILIFFLCYIVLGFRKINRNKYYLFSFFLLLVPPLSFIFVNPSYRLFSGSLQFTAMVSYLWLIPRCYRNKPFQRVRTWINIFFSILINVYFGSLTENVFNQPRNLISSGEVAVSSISEAKNEFYLGSNISCMKEETFPQVGDIFFYQTFSNEGQWNKGPPRLETITVWKIWGIFKSITSYDCFDHH